MDSQDTRKMPPATKKFAEMNALEKVVFIGKVMICAMSFGFIFPHIGE